MSLTEEEFLALENKSDQISRRLSSIGSVIAISGSNDRERREVEEAYQEDYLPFRKELSEYLEDKFLPEKILETDHGEKMLNERPISLSGWLESEIEKSMSVLEKRVEENSQSENSEKKTLPDILDDELREKIQPLYKESYYEIAVEQSSDLLEDRIREMSSLEGHGSDLVYQALHHQNGQLELPRNHDGENEGLYFLFRGAIQAFRNQTSHTAKEEYGWRTAYRRICLIDELIEVVEKTKEENES